MERVQLLHGACVSGASLGARPLKRLRKGVPFRVLGNQLCFATHEITAGILYGINCAMIDECATLLKDLHHLDILASVLGDSREQRAQRSTWRQRINAKTFSSSNPWSEECGQVIEDDLRRSPSNTIFSFGVPDEQF